MEDLRILLVEDEVRIADTLRMGLGENGYDVEVAYDGQIGWRMFQTKRFNLLILDINLPGITGYELTKMVRAQNENVPIIMLTALSSLDDKIEGYDAGADDYIIKPFEFKELLMKIRVLMRRTADVQAPVGNLLRADDLLMNLDTKEVKRDETTVHLTAKEFQLLEYLLRNKNRVVSRADIAINVWDIDFDTNTNIIDVYINYVRNKIDKPFPRKLIQTQVGMGYILKES
ncbi:response regulator transcription factor [Terrimonas sp. NA20]|uniref:Response regulator transcription factor n=1 Tax=Terrimonas ginsenosidimutans TaxID=2908004 RepID=A0ABS9KXF2_9BACT|nr:response regulator transcription factor [Terrimonas ginsenosidimutans]MCG2617022.1 response regulator transcription factor [Terrimonas ginsenosidimutans]